MTLKKQNELLKEALKAALKVIEQTPCDPDIYPEQIEAHYVLKQKMADLKETK